MSCNQLMNTINQTYQRSVSESLGISRNFIRKSVLNGKLRSVRAGSKYLINWNHLIELLNSPHQDDLYEDQSGNIRQVSESHFPQIRKQR